MYGLDREITRIRGCSTPIVDTPKQQQVDKGSQDSLSSPTSIGKFKGLSKYDFVKPNILRPKKNFSISLI